MDALRAQVRLSRIGFVFQSYNLLPVLTAEKNAAFTMLLQGGARVGTPRAGAAPVCGDRAGGAGGPDAAEAVRRAAAAADGEDTATSCRLQRKRLG